MSQTACHEGVNTVAALLSGSNSCKSKALFALFFSGMHSAKATLTLLRDLLSTFHQHRWYPPWLQGNRASACSLFAFWSGRNNLTLSHCPSSSFTSETLPLRGPVSGIAAATPTSVLSGRTRRMCLALSQGRESWLCKKSEQMPLSWLGNGSSVACCCPDRLSKHPVLFPNHFHTKGFCDLNTQLASLFKTSFKYYMKMLWTILWHWVLQAGNGLCQLCHQTLPAPVLDGHTQLFTETLHSPALASWLLNLLLNHNQRALC